MERVGALAATPRSNRAEKVHRAPASALNTLRSILENPTLGGKFTALGLDVEDVGTSSMAREFSSKNRRTAQAILGQFCRGSKWPHNCTSMQFGAQQNTDPEDSYDFGYGASDTRERKRRIGSSTVEIRRRRLCLRIRGMPACRGIRMWWGI